MPTCQLVTLLAALTVATLFSSANAIRCYSCDSRNTGECGDPFRNNSLVQSCANDAVGCVKNKQSGVGETTVYRSCYGPTGRPTVHSGCGSMTVDEVTQTYCVCDKDFCNSGQQLHSLYFRPHYMLIMIVGLCLLNYSTVGL